MTSTHKFHHAIVIGGSMAGLLAARVLSDHFSQVTLIERDKFNDAPESRRGQPQTRHLHGLLAGGRTILETYFPGLTASLQAGGATLGDMGQVARWHISGGYRVQYESGMKALMMSRPFLEWHVRQRVLQLPNLKVLDGCTVAELLSTPDGEQVTGVRLQSKRQQESEPILSTDLPANLVVDASGRGTIATRWLEALGYALPPETQVTVNVGYATRIFRRQPTDLSNAKLLLISPDPPQHHRSGVAFPIEGDRWIVTLASWGEASLPQSPESFLEFARSLPAPDIYDLICNAEPLSEVVGYRYPASLRRHYERLTRVPAGFLLIGDALCSFNPTYGQGMTSAALQAETLDQLLKEHSSLTPLARKFFQRVARIVDIPWQLAVGEDFRFATTVGRKTPVTDTFNWYATHVYRATHTDPNVYTAFLRVMNLLASPLSLLHPQILWRVWRANRQHPHALEQAALEPSTTHHPVQPHAKMKPELESRETA
jgi:2-polyprenyl-6-methoxyphenol hydroxylase-like FAD-dependent oxidoreductase